MWARTERCGGNHLNSVYTAVYKAKGMTTTLFILRNTIIAEEQNNDLEYGRLHYVRKVCERISRLAFFMMRGVVEWHVECAKFI